MTGKHTERNRRRRERDEESDRIRQEESAARIRAWADHRAYHHEVYAVFDRLGVTPEQVRDCLKDMPE